MSETIAQLRANNLGNNNFGTHVAVRINKVKFIEMNEKFIWDTLGEGLEALNCYSNYVGMQLPRARDNKFEKPDGVLQFMYDYEEKDYPAMFSTKPELNNEMKGFLKGMFPAK